MEKIKISLTSVNEKEKSFYQCEANVSKEKDLYVCTYVDNRDKNNIVNVKLILGETEGYIYQTRASGVNTMYFKSNNVYEGKYFFHDLYLDIRIETEIYRRKGLVTFVKYKSWINNVYQGQFEHTFEFKEKKEAEAA